MIEKSNQLGVVIGRFQIDFLHQGHRELIDTALAHHNKVVLFLGVSPLPNTKRNPLDFETRRAMIGQAYPNIEVYPVYDHPDDTIWSTNLDLQLVKIIGGNLPDAMKPDRAVLFGGRDSFLSHYHGVYSLREITPSVFLSATDLRKKLVSESHLKKSPGFRQGAITAAYARYATAYQTVDVAVYDRQLKSVLMAKKPDINLWRFIGGFSDVSSNSLEEDAIREVKEEAGIDITNPIYLCSRLVNDWRYTSEEDKIKTALFLAEFNSLSALPVAGDDVRMVGWVEVAKLNEETVEAVHLPLLEELKKHINI